MAKSTRWVGKLESLAKKTKLKRLKSLARNLDQGLLTARVKARPFVEVGSSRIKQALVKTPNLLSKAGKFVKAHPVMVGASVLGGIAVDRLKKARKRRRILGKSQVR